MLAIINATIATADKPLQENIVIIIANGKIKAVGPQAQLDTSPCDDIIDAAGRVITPGWIDTHTHLGIDEEGIAWEGSDFNEISDPITPHMRAIDGINPFDQGFHDAARAGITTVQVLPGSANVIGGITAIVKVKPNHVLSDIIINEVAGLKMALGENPKNFHGKNGKAPMTRMGIAALIRDALVDAQNAHGSQHERNLKREALSKAIKQEIPVCIHAHRADDIMTAIRLTEEFDLDLHIEHVTEGYLIAETLATYKDKVKFSLGPTLSSRKKVELNQLTWDAYRTFAEHHIPFSTITDHPVVPINQLQTSLQQAIAHGLDPQTALKSVTTYAADILNLSATKGDITTGKDADLVMWNRHPLTENGQAVLTMTEGEVVYRSESL
ncbi:amidohydrolase [Thalassobacillus sp. CUG 92003]|uniref:amidohydrolase n=1 Tax=Thalassobacillus sp. CUG 92003 TaxID=2736641 RepID=UPI0015E6C624|nr:amidohydrolase [Thalassobacillus sp. CUG 92003]